MTVDEALQLAAECGLVTNQVVTITPAAVEKFVRLVHAGAWGQGYRAGAQAERAICADIIEHANRSIDWTFTDCARAIRARGKL